MTFLSRYPKELRLLLLAFILVGIVITASKLFDFYQMKQLHTLTGIIYEHPLKVSNAALSVGSGIEQIHRDMQALIASPPHKALKLEALRAQQREVDANLRIIEKNILGEEGLRQVRETTARFNQWKQLLETMITQLQQDDGKAKAAALWATGCTQHYEILKRSTRKLYDYARSKASGFKQQSDELFEHLALVKASVILALLLMLAAIAFYTLRRLSEHLERQHRLTRTLAVIRDVNQLIVREKDLPKLLQQSCDILAREHVYQNAWIVLIDDNGKITHVTGSDRSARFIAFKEKLQEGWLPHCIRQTSRSQNASVLFTETEQMCGDCPVMAGYPANNAFNIRLHYETKVYGYLTLYIARNHSGDPEEQSLLDEIAGDIAYALYNIEREALAGQNETRYRYIVESTNDGIWDWDLVNGRVFFSARWKALLGYADDELEESIRTWELHLHPDDREATFAAIAQAKHEQTPFYKSIHRLRHKNGNWVWIEARGRTLFDADHTPIRMMGTHTDISQTKEREQIVIRLKEFYKSIIDSIDNMIFVKDEQFTYIECNGAFETFVGRSRDAIVGKTDYELFDKETADFFRAHDVKMLAQRKARSNIEWVTYPDGSKVCLLTHKAPLLDTHGTLLGLVGNASDVTEQKALEEALLESRNRYEAAEQVGRIGSWEYHIQNQTFWGSAQSRRMYGLPDDSKYFTVEMIEQCIPERERVHRALIDLIEHDAPYNLEFEIRPFDGGAAKIISSKATLERDEQGNALKVVGLIQDITERKTAQESLRISNEKFEKAFNQTPNSIIITRLKTGEIYDVNATFLKLFGYRNDEIIGKSTLEIHLWYDPVDRDLYIQSLHDNGTVNGDIYRFMTKSGDTVTAEVYASMVIINDETYILATAVDITAEQALEIENRKFIEMLDRSINELHVYNLDDLRYSYINKAALIALGYEKEEMLGRMTPSDIRAGALTEAFIREGLQPLLEKRTEKLSVFGEQRRKDGSTYPVEAQVQLLEIDGKQQIVVTAVDVTDKRRSEAALRRSREDYKLLADNVIDVIWKMDMQMTFTYVNPSIETLFGYSIKEFIGSRLDAYCSESAFAQMQSLLAAMLRENTPKGETFETLLRRKDGVEIPVEINAKLIFDRAGTATGLQGSVRDFRMQAEARKKLRDALKALEKKSAELQTILQEAPNPIMLHNEDGEVIFINRVWENLTGYACDEIDTINKWTQKAYGEKMPIAIEAIDLLYATGTKIDEGEYTITTKEGKHIIWQFSSAPLGVIDGKRTIITSAMDITELKQKEEVMLLQSRNAAMGEMIGMIAHQWRQPISVIAMNANNMQLDIELDTLDSSAVESYTRSILDQTQHLSKTIDDFRNFFKPDKERSLTTLEALLNETMKIVNDSLRNNNIAIRMTVRSDSEINTYVREMMQVFVNLINNAKDAVLKKMPPEPLIDITIDEEPHHVIARICDNGTGIEKAILPHIFEPYFTTKEEQNGTGLGLYMSKTIIEKHLHGTITAHNSENGACFEIRLPK